jgi:predicted  nucleic acid-binding Zn-ribbon protein
VKKQVNDLAVVQELDALMDELEISSGRQQEEAFGFNIEETTRLHRERERLATGISADLLRHYERLRERYPRAVVGTRGRVCLGCNTLRPTAMASRAAGLETCERCGRILYRVESPPAPQPPASTGGAETKTAPKRRGKPRRT